MYLQKSALDDQPSANDQLAKVKPFWQSLSQQERIQALSISLDDFFAKLLDLTDAGQNPEPPRLLTMTVCFNLHIDHDRWQRVILAWHITEILCCSRLPSTTSLDPTAHGCSTTLNLQCIKTDMQAPWKLSVLPTQ